jgi:hypothetical protein
VELDGRRSLTCGVGQKTRSGSGLWDVEGLLRRIGTKRTVVETVKSALEYLSRSSSCLSFLRHRHNRDIAARTGTSSSQRICELCKLQMLRLLLFL